MCVPRTLNTKKQILEKDMCLKKGEWNEFLVKVRPKGIASCVYYLLVNIYNETTGKQFCFVLLFLNKIKHIPCVNSATCSCLCLSRAQTNLSQLSSQPLLQCTLTVTAGPYAGKAMHPSFAFWRRCKSDYIVQYPKYWKQVSERCLRRAEEWRSLVFAWHETISAGSHQEMCSLSNWTVPN